MAGGNSFIKDPKKGKYNPAFDSAEVYKAPTNSVSSILNGVLRPGETIDFSQEIKTPEKPRFDSYIQKEQAIFVNEHQKEVHQEIQELLFEIKKLAKSTDNLEQSVELAADKPIVEFTAYERSFLVRIKNLIIQFRLNVSEASNCFGMFESRKKKKNAFWNKSKSGGQKYRDSGEHSASRSAN